MPASDPYAEADQLHAAGKFEEAIAMLGGCAQSACPERFGSASGERLISGTFIWQARTNRRRRCIDARVGHLRLEMP
jgi:hypothetical protein